MPRVNIACGSVFVCGGDWINLDFTATSAQVRGADLLRRWPLADASADAVYSSHFLEHIPRSRAAWFAQECFRVLKPGGMVRLVVPDFEQLCRTYLAKRAAGQHDLADFVVVEIIDQCVRTRPGGELGRIHRRCRSESGPEASELAAFVREQTGVDVAAAPPAGSRRPFLGAVRSRLGDIWTKAVCALLPRAFREQNVSFAHVGERHHWLWDFKQVEALLTGAGFRSVERLAHDRSAIPGFELFPLDRDESGGPRKGAESMYVEAVKP